MKTNDRRIEDLLKAVAEGKAQLPDFQRSWVWDDDRIKALIASVVHDHPVGAAMFLTYGTIKFKYRPIEGSAADGKAVKPTELILDGQQRLTSLYSVLYSQKPVKTKTDRGKTTYRYYYIDIEKSLDPNADDEEIIISVPEKKQITSDFGKTIDLDLTTPEMEFKNKLFPLNSIFDTSRYLSWQNGYQKYYNFDTDASELFYRFAADVVKKITAYQMPVISLDEETPREAVCRVFENVNTGGVPLNVFELVVASYSADDFELRKDWDDRKEKFNEKDVLKIVEPTEFLSALTLLSTYKRKLTNDKVAVSCKKKDILNLTLDEYKKYKDVLTEGFMEAEKILQEERVFTREGLPYKAQIVPLAAICTVLKGENRLGIDNVKNKIKQWYWCGVFGELYGSSSDTRFANDIVQVIKWLDDRTSIPKTVQDFYFNPIRLLSLQTNRSAPYKGIMALILKNHAKDFISGREMDLIAYKSEKIDLHHIFPSAYCERMKFLEEKWNSVVNKTPISYSTNRMIGGVSPSKYLEKIEKDEKVDQPKLNEYLKTHWIEPSLVRVNNFDEFIVERAKMLLDAIERATGRTISGRDSDEVAEKFGKTLVSYPEELQGGNQ
ncbi:MAG: DUF262 domain-containing protein [Thermoguttaceae bacterium]|nr:DUF262 domain-containing protein [Thermoguttaceae bacterium]